MKKKKSLKKEETLTGNTVGYKGFSSSVIG